MATSKATKRNWKLRLRKVNDLQSEIFFIKDFGDETQQEQVVSTHFG